MDHIKWIFILSIIIINALIADGEAVCKSIQSRDSTVSCNGNGTLMSCGYTTDDPFEEAVPGVIFNSSSQSCTTAWNNYPQQPSNQTLVARCCNIQEIDELDCNEPGNISSNILNNGGIRKSIQCSDSEILFGCSSANYNSTDPQGAYPFRNNTDFTEFNTYPINASSSASSPTCVSEAASSSVTPQGTCCDNAAQTTFECKTVINKDRLISSVNCQALGLGSDYFMASCSGYSDGDGLPSLLKYVFILSNIFFFF